MTYRLLSKNIANHLCNDDKFMATIENNRNFLLNYEHIKRDKRTIVVRNLVFSNPEFKQLLTRYKSGVASFSDSELDKYSCLMLDIFKANPHTHPYLRLLFIEISLERDRRR